MSSSKHSVLDFLIPTRASAEAGLGPGAVDKRAGPEPGAGPRRGWGRAWARPGAGAWKSKCLAQSAKNC